MDRAIWLTGAGVGDRICHQLLMKAPLSCRLGKGGHCSSGTVFFIPQDPGNVIHAQMPTAKSNEVCPFRAENPKPSIAAMSTTSWSLTSSKASTSEQAAAATYAIVLKDGTESVEVKQICAHAYANLGLACRQTLQHTVNGFTVQVSQHLEDLWHLHAQHDFLGFGFCTIGRLEARQSGINSR